MNNIEQLREGGFSDVEISKMLDLPVSEIAEKKQELEVNDGSELDNLKSDIYATAQVAVGQIKKDIGGRPDAQELSKLTDSLSKLYPKFDVNIFL